MVATTGRRECGMGMRRRKEEAKGAEKGRSAVRVL